MRPPCVDQAPHPSLRMTSLCQGLDAARPPGRTPPGCPPETPVLASSCDYLALHLRTELFRDGREGTRDRKKREEEAGKEEELMLL